MQAAFLPASSGWQWVRDGFRLFRKQPLAMFTWALVNSLLVIFAFAAQIVGPEHKSRNRAIRTQVAA